MTSSPSKGTSSAGRAMVPPGCGGVGTGRRRRRRRKRALLSGDPHVGGVPRFAQAEREGEVAGQPVAAELGPSPRSRVRARSARPSSSWAGSHRRSASGTSPSLRRSASARAHTSSAPLAVAAAACGRTEKAASPTRHTRPKAMRGTSTSIITCRNGSAVFSATSAIGGGSWASAVARKSARCSSRTAPGGRDTSRCFPDRSVSRSASGPPRARCGTRPGSSAGVPARPRRRSSGWGR